MVGSGDADAGVVSRLFGAVREEARARPTSIIIEPVQIRFAAPRGKGMNLLATIDRHLAEAKQTPGSFYAAGVRRWLPAEAATPRWLGPVLAVAAAAILGLALTAGLMLRRARARAGDLRQARSESAAAEGRYRELFDHDIDGYVRLDSSGRIVETNPAFDRMLGRDAAELAGLSLQDLTPPRVAGTGRRAGSASGPGRRSPAL